MLKYMLTTALVAAGLAAGLAGWLSHPDMTVGLSSLDRPRLSAFYTRIRAVHTPGEY